jgi:predicted transposase/invertase (TIGR01784 family)
MENFAGVILNYAIMKKIDSIIDTMGHDKEQELKEILRPRYVSILTNGGFKAIFADADNKAVIIDIMNAFLPENRQVRDIVFMHTEYPSRADDGKEYRFDFMCRDENDVYFIVEAQNYFDDNWPRRCVSYTSRVYDAQNIVGKEYVAPPVYLIGLMGVPIKHGDMSQWKDRYVAEYTFREKETLDLLDETIFIIFAEIARFDKRQDDCVSLQERMLYILKHSQDIKKPVGWLAEGIYARLLHAFEVAKFTKEKLIRYIQDMMDERKRISEMNTYTRMGRDEGREEGRAEGLAEGMEKERLTNARKMKVLGVDIAVICQVTGLAEEQISEL